MRQFERYFFIEYKDINKKSGSPEGKRLLKRKYFIVQANKAKSFTFFIAQPVTQRRELFL